MLKKGVVLACCLLTAAAAQESRPGSAAASRPAAVELVMKHGLTVRIVPLDLPGEIGVILGIEGAGILAEPAGAPHVAHVSEHAVFHSMPAESPLAKAVDAWYRAGRANAETLPEMMYFDVFPSSAELGQALHVQIARALGIAAPGNLDPVLEREKPVALGEITSLETTRMPELDFMAKFAWCPFTQAAVHGAKEVAMVEGTKRLTATDVLKFCSSTDRFRFNRSMLVVFGDVDPVAVEDQIGGLLDKITISMKRGPAPSQPIKPGAIQANWDVASDQVFMAWPAPPPADPAHPALSLAAHVLSRRIAMSPSIAKLRRDPHAVYGDVAGLFVIQAPLKKRSGGDALVAELRRAIDLAAVDPSAIRSLKAAQGALRQSAGILSGPMQYPPQLKRRIVAHANVELARMRATMAWDQSPEDYCARVEKVTGPEIQAAIKAWLAPEKATIVTIVGKE